MLERLAVELEQSATEEAAAVVDPTTAAQLTGFARGHLRRLFREGRLEPVRMEGDEPLFRVSDLPRKAGAGGQAEEAVRAAVFGERRVGRAFPRVRVINRAREGVRGRTLWRARVRV
jgi:hypothetical protein